MNVNPVSANPIQTNFGCCGDGKCTCCCPQPTMQPTQDVVEISKFQKAKNACKKGIGFIKTNKSAIGVTLASVGAGLLTACTVLGGNQLMSKITKSDTSALAAKLAAIGGVAAAATNLIKHKDVFKKQAPQVKQ